MVLKVVTGKILETLELRSAFRAMDGSKYYARDPSPGWKARGFRMIRLSKIQDYLADNLCVLMLSHVTEQVQEECRPNAELVPNWESRANQRFREHTGKAWAACRMTPVKSVVSCWFSVLSSFSRGKARGILASHPFRKNAERMGHPTSYPVQPKATPSFCRSVRSCSAVFIWMTCIPNREALSRFSGRSSIKQHSSGGRCVISKARR